MFAIASFFFAGLGYIMDGTHAQTSAWFSPLALGLLSLAALALHAINAGWPRR